jgi:hypothetical protein
MDDSVWLCEAVLLHNSKHLGNTLIRTKSCLATFSKLRNQRYPDFTSTLVWEMLSDAHFSDYYRSAAFPTVIRQSGRDSLAQTGRGV